MTVVNPKSISGINSITTGSGSDDILTIHTNNGTERLRVDSTGTTKIVTGIVTTLTATTGIATHFTVDKISLPDTSGFVGSINVGLSSDLQISHNGSKSMIRGATATNIDIKTAADFFVTHADTDGSNGENCIVVRGDGEVELYHDGSLRLATTSAGVSITSAIDVGDNGKLLCGDSDDLQIDHSGTNSQIYHNGTGDLYIATLGSGEDLHLTSTSGKLTLNTGGSERLRVTDDGIKFNGDTAAANALDDYEEGVHTATATCNTSGTITLDTSHNKLAYHKIGNWINVHGRVRVTSTSSPSGQQLRISLPYQSASEYGGDASRITGFATIENADQNQINYGIQATYAGNTFVQVGNVNLNSTNPADVCSQVNSNSLITINVTYRTV